MSVKCLFLLLPAAITFMLLRSSSSAFIPGAFNSCSEAACISSLSNRPCPVDENNACKCEASNSSACGTLDQPAFLNLTGAANESTSQWACCFCSSDGNYCCNKCGNTTAVPAVILPTRYYSVILVFVLECKQFSDDEKKLKTSLKQGIVSLTSIPLDRVTVKGINCATGPRPFCGVDVEDIRAHHRARRLVGGRMKGKSSSKNKGGSINSYRQTIHLTCDALYANIKVYGRNLTLLQMSMELLRYLQSNNSLVIPLWDGRSIYSSFMLSAIDDMSYSLNKAPTTAPPPLPPTESMSPLEVDLTPMIYAGASIVGLIAMCVLWKFIKHSWLLYRKRFTPINSDRVDHKKAQQRQRIMEAMEENDCRSHVNGGAFITSSGSLPRGNNEVMTKQHNWSRSLAPAYKPTELHNHQTPPKLILDDDGSDIDRHSIDSESVVNLENDESFSDILDSDDERMLRPSTGSSRFSQGIGNPGFIEGSTAPIEEVKKTYSSKTRTKPKSPSLVVNDIAHSELLDNRRIYREGNKGSPASSDLSLDAEEKTVFLPVKEDKKNKKKDSGQQKKGKILLSPSKTEKKVRRTSITPLNEADRTRKQSETEMKEKKSLTIESAQDGGRRKSISPRDNEVKIVTPKDKYNKGGKNGMAFTFENQNNEDAENSNKNRTKKNDRLSTPSNGRRKSLIVDVEDGNSSDRNGTKMNERLTVSASPVTGRRKSSISAEEDAKSSNRKKIKMNERLTMPVSERRKSSIADEGEARTFDGKRTKGNNTSLVADEDEEPQDSGRNRTKMNEGSTTAVPVSENRTAEMETDTKRKKKKVKTEKQTKRKADESEDLSNLEEEIAPSAQGIAQLNVMSATPEMKRRKSTTPGDKETKKKKKKRKEKEANKRKSEDSEQSDEDVEDKIKEISSNFFASETEQAKQALDTEEAPRKKKKQKNVTTAKRKSLNPEAMQADEDINEAFTQSAIKADSLEVRPERKRKKSLILEDIESKSQTDEVETWSKSEQSQRQGPSQDIAHLKSERISPIPTGYKSPMLVIKPSNNKY